MIHSIGATDFTHLTGSIAAVYIAGLANAYGDVSFLRFYADGASTALAVMDGVGYLHCTDTLSEEWLSFLSMVPDLQCLHTDSESITPIAEQWKNTPIISHIMIHSQSVRHNNFTDILSGLVHPEAVYHLLSQCFIPMPPFDSWYVDLSHRIRHGYGHITTYQQNGRCISCAVTVAEAPDAAVIGGVCTHPDYRGQGLASRCVQAILQEKDLSNRRVYLTVENKELIPFYKHQGFEIAGKWNTIYR